MRLSVVVAVGIAGAAAAWIASGLFTEPSEATPGTDGAPGAQETAAQEQGPAFEVRVADLVAEPFVEEVAAFGHTGANRTVAIAAEIDGRIAEVLVENGSRVAAGDPIARIAISDLEAQVAQAQSLVEQRRVEYNAAAELGQSGYSARNQVATARANLSAAQAQLTQWQDQLAKTEITSPFAGVINDRAVELGSYVHAGDTIATLVDLDPVIISVYVTERHVGRVQVGALAEAALVTGETVDGIVRYVSAVADAATRTYEVEIEVANDDGAIVAGMTADVRIPGRQIMAYLISPAVIALADDGTIGVRVVDDRDVVQFMPITLLTDTTGGLWITGLPDRVRLITVGQEYVSEGQRVTPVYQPSGSVTDRGEAAS